MRGLIEASGSSSDIGYWKWYRRSIALNSIVLFIYAFAVVAGATLSYNLFT